MFVNVTLFCGILIFICGANIGFFLGGFFASVGDHGEDYEEGYRDGYEQGLYANGYAEALKDLLTKEEKKEGKD